MKHLFAVFMLSTAIVLSACKKDDKPIEVAGVKLSETTLTLAITESKTLVATVEPADAADKTVVWSTSAEKIATVDKDGKVIALAIGSAVIKATAGSASATCTVTVSPEMMVKGVAFLYVPAGMFQMGAPASEPNSKDEERPVHQVTLTKGFYLSKYEITNAQFATFLNENKVASDGIWPDAKLYKDMPLLHQSDPETGFWGLTYDSKWKPCEGKDEFPAVYITWCGAVEYAAWMGGFLPSEAQWEYACRAGSSTPFSLGTAGNGNQFFGTMANFKGTNPYDIAKNGEYYDETGINLGMTSKVGSYSPNAWGFYDMHGNAREWCLDMWDETVNYPSAPVTDPVMTKEGVDGRIARGGAYFQPGKFCRSANRMAYSGTRSNSSSLGVRVAIPLAQ